MLKVHLSKLNQKQIVTLLIRNILTLRPTWERNYDVQALADEGSTAVPSIISALEEIHQEIKRNGFTKRGGSAKLLMYKLLA